MTEQKPQPELDETFDALNDETFGDEEDEWEWSGDAPGELCPSPNQLSLERDLFPTTTTATKPPLHSSNLMTSMSSITNVSGIRRLSDIEKSFSSMGMQDNESDLPDDPAIMKMTKSPHQPLMSSLIHDHSASSDPFSSFSVHANRLSSSVWAPPDQSLFDTSSIPCSLSSGSPVPPAPPSDPWNNSLNQQTSDRLSNNMNSSSNRMVNALLGIESPAKGSGSGDGPILMQKPISLQELEASFLSESSSPIKQTPQEQKLPQSPLLVPVAQQHIQHQTQDRVTGHPSNLMTASGTPHLPLHVNPADQNRPPHPMQMMRLPVHPALGMPFHQPLPAGRANLVQHPHIQQNFLMIQQAPYRPPAPLPLPPPHQMLPHPFLNPQQMHNIQMQQRLPYHRVNYVNNYNNTAHMNRMPNQPHEAIVRKPVDEYAGFMSQKEREWLIRIQKLQLESSISDPYVEDYYAMCYNSKKLAEAKSRESQAAPTLVLMEPRMISRGAASASTGDNSGRNDPTLSGSQKTGASSYVPLQFENSLGKIQVSNIQCPRKLLDLMSLSEKRAQASGGTVASSSTESAESAKPLARKELTKFRKLLLEIERLYLILLKIDQEDKRMAALPPDQRLPHFELREQFCCQLFEGLTNRSDPERVRLNVEIASIRKGCALIFRSLQLLHDVSQKETIITDLLDEENFHLIANQKDKDLYSLDYLKILFEAMKSINPSLTDEELTKVSL